MELHSPFLGDDFESMCKKDTEAHTGNIKYPLCNNKPHWEEEVGCWDKRQDNQRQGLRKADMMDRVCWDAQRAETIKRITTVVTTVVTLGE